MKVVIAKLASANVVTVNLVRTTGGLQLVFFYKSQIRIHANADLQNPNVLNHLKDAMKLKAHALRVSSIKS